MALLIGIALVAGMVTAISPCVLPVLPVVFAGSATGGRRRPYAIVAGLVLSFTAFTLAATALLDALALPQDLLRNIAIGVVAAMGLALLAPRIGHALERPFQALGRRAPGDVGGGLLLGVSLGLLFTPCAGPIIGAIAFVAATQRFSVEAVAVTLAYAAGAGLVLLALALAVRTGLDLAPLRARAPAVRRAFGALVLAVAVLMAIGLDTRLQARVPGYARALQGLEDRAARDGDLARLVQADAGDHDSTALDDFGRAPEFARIEGWLNSEPLTMESLRGKVVLIDFWTYSCVNCIRTLPYLREWHRAYADRGLVIVGVHTPEFAFERVPENVRNALHDLDVDWPVALDPDFGTWSAWGNQYWPAEYVVDRQGHVRFAHFGEGEYEEKERVIRELLDEDALPEPVAAAIPDQTPTAPQTPETYLGSSRVDRFAGATIEAGRFARYELPGFVPEDEFALGGEWKVEPERAIAGRDARIRLHYRGGRVFLVLGPAQSGAGAVEVTLDGEPVGTVTIDGHRLYPIAVSPTMDGAGGASHLLDLRLTPGVEAYAFTFGT